MVPEGRGGRGGGPRGPLQVEFLAGFRPGFLPAPCGCIFMRRRSLFPALGIPGLGKAQTGGDGWVRKETPRRMQVWEISGSMDK